MLTALRPRRGRVLVSFVEPSNSDTPGTATVVAESTGVDPGPITLATAGTFQLDVLGTDAGSGLALTGFSENWQTTNAAVATVSGTGLVTGVGAGSCSVSCTITKNGVSATDSIDSTITVGAPVVTQVARSPATVSGTVAGSTVDITYQAQDASGNAISGQTYTADSSDTNIATVAVTGNIATVTFIAIGSCTITGHVGAVDSATTAVTVNAPGSGPFANEPAGLTVICEHACDLQLPTTEGASGSNVGVYERSASYAANNATTLTAASVGLTAPYGDGNLWRFRYPSGQRAGTGATYWRGWKTSIGGARPTFTTIYFGFWFNLFGNGTNYEMSVQLIKMFGFLGYGVSLGSTPNQGYWVTSSSSDPTTSLSLNFRQQGAVSRSVPGSKALSVNTWYLYEMLATINPTVVAGGTGATSDGTLKQWITTTGGVQTLFCNRTDMAWNTTGNTNGFHMHLWNNTYGGTGTDKTRNDDTYVAHYRSAGS